MCVLPCFVLPRNIAVVTVAIQVRSLRLKEHLEDAHGSAKRLGPRGVQPDSLILGSFHQRCGSIFGQFPEGSHLWFLPCLPFSLRLTLQDCHWPSAQTHTGTICQAPVHDRQVNSDIFTLDFTQVECSHHVDLWIFRCWQADSFAS